MTTIYTIGYEAAAVTDFIATLEQAGVQHVLDVRELPQSRRPGFSKKALAGVLAAVGIGYSHSKQLGDPKLGREAARRGDMESFRAIFEAHLDTPASSDALSDAAALVVECPTVLLCYERDPSCCHRSLVVKRLQRLRSLNVRHLGVREHGAASRHTGAQTALRHA